jgi:hypothetical protein
VGEPMISRRARSSPMVRAAATKSEV